MLYGAAEFSRDADLALLASPENLERLRAALDELQAECIAVPPLEQRYLDMGLAVHFRCRHPDALNVRLDVMSKMRGVADFESLWQRRTTLTMGDQTIEVMSLPDLVSAKKTQRDKDWPMITRLVEANYFANVASPTPEQVAFWLQELRTPRLLVEVAARFPDECQRVVTSRPLLSHALSGDESELTTGLHEEERLEREADREYWKPLRAELERLRRERRS
ncbi:MAG TPA: hypothetical protein VML55_07435 [Planctomycetaceae bacterium]|nr:hypothetical protein [Planctomycetaceae bacterium]